MFRYSWISPEYINLRPVDEDEQDDDDVELKRAYRLGTLMRIETQYGIL